MTIWFTSDTFFGHEKIIPLHQRPFADATSMDDALIDRWNARVQPEDEVWHLGNFVAKRNPDADRYLARLNGRKHLVWGNNDRDPTRAASGWASCQPYWEMVEAGQLICLFHYPMRVWRRCTKGALHLYGHSHGTLAGDRQCCDVGVDNRAWSFAPVSLEEVLVFLEHNKPRIEPRDATESGAV